MLCIRWLFRVARDSLKRADTLFNQREEEEKSLIDGVAGLRLADGGNSGNSGDNIDGEFRDDNHLKK